ncbi:hypothetical protein QFC24_006768 [Naganishia onofrii]|uniref:Uncharacterized protein n=1 Tax=Naganishia onofrii TaxID=1851511 RepID=A0ACC2WXR2_9TREE|nr:hypothetical protein QFC24_006768 [Naganishia onofrii]
MPQLLTSYINHFINAHNDFRHTTLIRQTKKNDSMQGDKSDLPRDPRLPLELMSLIGGILAADNAYASLANFSLICHAVHQHAKRTLYETVILDARKCFNLSTWYRSRVSLCRYTKYLIVENHLRCQLDNKFPRLKVVLTMDLDNDRYPHLLPGRIDVFESVNVTTVSILLQIPLLWQVYDEGEVQCEPVSSVDRITVKDEAWVLGHVPAEKDDDWLSKRYCRLLRTQFDLEHQYPSEDLRRTLVNLLWLTLSVVDRPRNEKCYLDGAAKEDVPGLDFVATNGGIPVADLLIKTLALPLTKICPQISIHLDLGNITGFPTTEEKDKLEKELHQHLSKAARIYSGIWSRMESHVQGYSFKTDDPFYYVQCAYGSLDMYCEFCPVDTSEQFKVEIAYMDDVQHEYRSVTLLEPVDPISEVYSLEREGFLELFAGR